MKKISLIILLIMSCGKNTASSYDINYFFRDRISLFTNNCNFTIQKDNESIVIKNQYNEFVRRENDISIELELFNNLDCYKIDLKTFYVLRCNDLRYYMVSKGNIFSCVDSESYELVR